MGSIEQLPIGTTSAEDLIESLISAAVVANPAFTGASGPSKSMLGLSNVDNTSDLNKPISTATVNELALKAPVDSPDFTGIPKAPTAAPETASTQIASTEFVQNALAPYEKVSNLTIQREYVASTAPPVVVDADEHGMARFVLRADGTIESTVEQLHGGNIVSLPGYAYAVADVYGYAVEVQRNDGSFLELDPAPPRGIAGDTHLLLVDGQSPFVASATSAISTSPSSGLKMFNVGALPRLSDFSNANTTFTSFVNHVESGNETSARGMAEGILAAAAACGRPIREAGSEIVSVVTAVGGQSINALGPGGIYWHHKTSAVDRWAAICAATGKIPGQVFWGVWQGEADTAAPMGGAAWAAAWEAARQSLEDYIESVLGRRCPVVQVHMQTSANFYYNRPLPLISEAANILARYPRIFGPIATYDYSFGAADGVGAHMSSAADSRHAGWRCGYAIGQCWAGIRPNRIVPTGATRIGARMVRIEYGGGYTSPLSLSTAIVTDPGNFGFEIGVYDAAGSFVAMPLTAVKVVGGEAVILRANADLPTGRLVVRYGYIGGALDDSDPDVFGSFSGRTTGARGCLQAETGRTVNIGGSTVTEYLRPTIHSIILE